LTIMRAKTPPRSISMKPANPRILTINGGLSSIKFALFCYQVKQWIGVFAAAAGQVD
jgi:hypothetical protein